MKIRASSIKALGFFVIVLTISFGAVTWYTLGELQTGYEQQKQLSLNNEWDLLRNTLNLSLNQAKIDGTNKVQEIKHYLYMEFENDYEALSKSLDNYHEPNNKVREIITVSLTDMYFNNIQSDNTDPFIVRGNYVELDSSANCASYGSSRTVDDEYTMHANPYLAKYAFERIKLADLENQSTAAIDRPIFFQFVDHPKGNPATALLYAETKKTTTPEEHLGKRAQELESYDMDGIKAYFFKTESWEDTFRAFEFITPTYLYSKTDLAGRAYILNGKRTEIDRLSLNIVFNFKTVIDHNTLLKRDLAKYKWERSKAEQTYYSTERALYFVVMLLILICYMAMNYANKLAQETYDDNNNRPV